MVSASSLQVARAVTVGTGGGGGAWYAGDDGASHDGGTDGDADDADDAGGGASADTRKAMRSSLTWAESDLMVRVRKKSPSRSTVSLPLPLHNSSLPFVQIVVPGGAVKSLTSTAVFAKPPVVPPPTSWEPAAFP